MEMISPCFTIWEALFTVCQFNLSFSASIIEDILLREAPNPEAAIESIRKEATVEVISLQRSSRGAIVSRLSNSQLTLAEPICVKFCKTKSAILVVQIIFTIPKVINKSPICSRLMPSPMRAPKTSR